MLLTGLAAVWLLTIVTSHMDVQFVYPSEMFTTGVTLTQHITCVVQHMIVQINLAIKTVFAVIAAVRLLARVNLEVDFQGVNPSKLFSTGVTLIGPLPCVDSHVSCQK